MDIQAILEAIPHRYPILLVDRVLENDPGVEIHAIKNVSANEPFFQGHFPGRPIMPGVLQIEALAQASGLCALSTADVPVENKLMLFRGIEKVKFRRTVVPGDQLHLHGKMLKRRLRDQLTAGDIQAADLRPDRTAQ